MMRHAAGSAENPRRGSLVKRHAAIWADRLGHLVSLPFAKVKRIPANLYEVTALQCAITRGRSGNKYRPIRTDKCLRASQFDDSMLRKNAGVFEEIDVRRLAAANGGDRLIKDELLSRQRSRSHIEPAIFERAFNNAYGDTGGQTEQPKANTPTELPPVLVSKADGIEEHATQSGANQSAQNSVLGLGLERSTRP